MKNMFLVVVLFCLVIFVSLSDFENSEVVYDCGMAEWHPDIPTKVKEECRRKRYEEWKKQNEHKRYTTT